MTWLRGADGALKIPSAPLFARPLPLNPSC